jgi:hypothetical protein
MPYTPENPDRLIKYAIRVAKDNISSPHKISNIFGEIVIWFYDMVNHLTIASYGICLIAFALLLVSR